MKRKLAIATFALLGLVAAQAQDIYSSRPLTAEEKAFELRTRKALFDLIMNAQKSAFGADYMLTDSELALEPSLGINHDDAKLPYCYMFELRFVMQPGTARFNRTQAEIQKLTVQAMNLQNPEDGQAFADVHNPDIMTSPLFTVYINDAAHLEFISFRKNGHKLTKPGAKYVIRGDGETSTALYFGHFGPLRADKDTTPGSLAFAASPQFNPRTPRLAVQSVLIVLRAPHEFVDAWYSKFDLAALQRLIVP